MTIELKAFGVKEIAPKKTTNPYLMMRIKPTNPKENYSFEVSKTVPKMLGIFELNNAKIAFASSKDDTKVYLIEGSISLDKLKVMDLTQKLTFANKDNYELLEKVFNLDTTKENYFRCMKVLGEELDFVEIQPSSLSEIESMFLDDFVVVE